MGKGANTAKGAAGGAMTGAAFGSAVPGVGTAIGAGVGGVLGGLSGYFGSQGGGNDYEEQLRKLSAGYGNRTAPQMGPAAQGTYSQFRGNQAGLIAQLEAMAAGHGPSAAGMQMREAMDRSMGAQASAAAGAGGRGVNAGAAFRESSNNMAALQSQGARDTGLMRVQEQLGATNQLGQVVAQGRAGDESMNQFNAQQTNQVNTTNLDAKLKMLGITDESQLRALLAAMQARGPAMGDQMLAGGATATPAILQWAEAQKKRNPDGTGGA